MAAPLDEFQVFEKKFQVFEERQFSAVALIGNCSIFKANR
jgi:hypothetical protein